MEIMSRAYVLSHESRKLEESTVSAGDPSLRPSGVCYLSAPQIYRERMCKTLVVSENSRKRRDIPQERAASAKRKAFSDLILLYTLLPVR